MKFNPALYFIKKYHSPYLTPKELKFMLNLWLPFILNRIKIQSISDDFSNVNIILKHSFWNRNPNKSLWGGALFSAVDPFYPMMIKQILLRDDIETIFLTKSAQVEYLRESKTNILFSFEIRDTEIDNQIQNINDKLYDLSECISNFSKLKSLIIDIKHSIISNFDVLYKNAMIIK